MNGFQLVPQPVHQFNQHNPRDFPRITIDGLLRRKPAQFFKFAAGIKSIFRRVDRGDGYVDSLDEFHPDIEKKLLGAMRGNSSKHRARSLGLAAIRETAEESGLLLGKKTSYKTDSDDWKLFETKGVSPSLANLRLISRAITPPGVPRRFDTWFFAANASEIAHTPESGFDPSGELEELRWLTPQEAIESNTREITRVMLVELMNRLKGDPQLSPDHSVPCYFARQGKFSRQEI